MGEVYGLFPADHVSCGKHLLCFRPYCAVRSKETKWDLGPGSMDG